MGDANKPSRFSLELSKYEAEIHHVPGAQNEISDLMSRAHSDIDTIISENKQNNDPSNLQAISPSKHSRTHYTNGNKRKRVRKCLQCGKKFICVDEVHCSNSCSSSYNQKGGIHNKISVEELEKLVWQIPTTKIAIKLNCSDVMISKLCKKWNISKPPRGYWAKQKTV
jgi:hypothetical protein